jgi:hypothetical protein
MLKRAEAALTSGARSAGCWSGGRQTLRVVTLFETGGATQEFTES